MASTDYLLIRIDGFGDQHAGSIERTAHRDIGTDVDIDGELRSLRLRRINLGKAGARIRRIGRRFWLDVNKKRTKQRV